MAVASELIPLRWTGAIQIWEMDRQPTKRQCVQPQSRGRKGAAAGIVAICRGGSRAARVTRNRHARRGGSRTAPYGPAWRVEGPLSADNLGCRAAPSRPRLCGCMQWRVASRDSSWMLMA